MTDKFKEQFPSLIRQSRDKNCEGRWMDWYYIDLFEEGGMDDSSGNAKSIEDASYVDIESVMENCIDNQRAKEAYTLLKASLGDGFFEIGVSPYARALIEFGKMLGLDK